MAEQTDQLLTWKDVLSSLEERALIAETMVVFAQPLANDKMFVEKWGRLSLRERVNCIDWTEYLSARRYLSRPDALSAYIKLRHCP